jgi:tRNA threonylcarbamoyladenosine modification (KEOPS) complex  Pcc1 subunit
VTAIRVETIPTADSRLILLNDGESQLCLDPVDVSDNPPAVSFNIDFSWTTQFQSCRIGVKECWIDHDALLRFEAELEALAEREDALARLTDMDEQSVVEVEREQERVVIRICAQDSNPLGHVVFTIFTYVWNAQEMLRRLQEYPKWW